MSLVNSEMLSMEKHAIEFRKRFDMDADSVVDFNELLSQTGIVTIFKPLHGDFAGMAFKQGDHRFMMINSNHAKSKQHFSICHEIYHLMVQTDFVPHQCKTELFDRKKDRTEYMADLFASHLILPTAGLLEKIPQKELKKDTITLDTVVQIEQYFQCSRHALLFRLSELNLISEDLRSEYRKNVIKSARARGYSDDLYTAANEGKFIGDQYLTELEEAYDADLISQSQYLQMKFRIGEDLY